MSKNLKIKGKFYPLKHDELIAVAHANLTRFEILVLYYIRTLDPYSDGVEISASQIARDLSTREKEVCRQTVSRALKKLDAQDYIDLEIVRAVVKLSGKGQLVSGNTNGVCTHQEELADTKGDEETPLGTGRHQKEPTDTKGDEETPETYIRNAHAGKTLKDFKQTCSNLNQTLSEAPEKNDEKEGEEFTVVEAELVCPEEVLNFAIDHNISHPNSSELVKIQRKDDSSEACGNNPRLEQGRKLWEQYVSDKITSFPSMELRLVADYRLGVDFCKTYRHSGDIGCKDRNDYKNDFIGYVAANELSGHLRGRINTARQMIANIERSPERWGELELMVQAWLQGKSQAELSRELISIQRRTKIHQSVQVAVSCTSSVMQKDSRTRSSTTVSAPSNQALNTQKNKIVAEIDRINRKLDGPFSGAYPKHIREQFRETIQQLQRKLLVVNAELEFGF